MPPGRPPANKPATAFDRRRYITLVQVLAIDHHGKRHDGIQALCNAWGINSNGMIYDEIINTLANHVVNYHGQEQINRLSCK